MTELTLKPTPKSALHDKLLNAVRSRVRLAEQSGRSNLTRMWDDAEKTVKAYAPEREVDAVRRGRRRSGEHEYTSISVPYSTAILMTAYTYWASVFLSRDPVFQFTALSGQPEAGVLGLEALMNYQLTIGEMLVPLHVWLVDVGKYGRGIIGTYWEDEKNQIAYLEEQPVMVAGIEQPEQTQRKMVREMIGGYQGNRIYNIRPHDFLPDPRVPLSRFQKGEFCGVKTRMHYNELFKKQKQGIYFNIDALRMHAWNGGQDHTSSVPGIDMPDDGQDFTLASDGERNPGFANIVEMVIEIIPSQWGITAEDYPEKWVLTLANDTHIIGVRPLGCLHNKFPYQVLEYEVDGYSLVSRGIPKILEQLNFTIEWLINSHFFNVRSILNGTVVVDPMRIEMGDLKRDGPGRVFRLTPLAYGTDVRTVISQLPLNDVTQNNLRDVELIADMMQKLIGTSDAVMGQLDSGGRKTATEVRTSSTFGVNRLKVNCEFFSAMGFAPLTRTLLSNTQQYYAQERMFRIAGDQLSQGQFVNVNPTSIAGEFDYMPVDGTLPIDRFAQASLWKELLMGLGATPELAQGFDIAGIFAWVAKLSGLKNINQFRLDVQQPGAGPPPGMAELPQGEMQREVPMGNVGQAGPVA